MRPCSSAVLLALLLLVTASVARAQPSPCQNPVRRIELATSPSSLPELCISPGLSTTLLFDQELATDAVELEGRERFRRVEATGSALVLVPSEKLVPGERLRLKVRFTEAGTPASAAFVLTVYRDQAERQVEIARPPAPGICQAELQRKEEELQRCLDQRASPPPQALASLAALMMENAIDPRLLTSREVTSPSLIPAPAEGLAVTRVMLHRSLSRFVVEVHVTNTDPERPWMAAGATLLGRSGEVLEPFHVLQLQPLEPGEFGQVWVEAPVPSAGAIGPFTLEVWDSERTRTFTLKGLRMP
jgi:uncharacterized protein (TIGR02268 family)